MIRAFDAIEKNLIEKKIQNKLENEEKLRSDIKAMIWELIPEEVLKNSE